MVNIRLTVFLLLGLLSATAYASESYLCVADMAAGFSFDKNRREWKSGNFHTEDKYIISKAKTGEYVWEVKEVGAAIALSSCKNDFNEFGLLACEGVFEFRMNKNNLRFLSAYLIGYWIDSNKADKTGYFIEGENTPLITIGKCSPL